MVTTRTGQTTDFSNQGTEFSVSFQTTDGSNINGTAYIPNFKKWHGYYRQIPELRTVINKFASWTFGRGIKGGEEQLQKIKGFGKDSARSVLKNQWRVALICGDSFAHILPGGNLKPLNPDRIAIVTNEFGIIIGYQEEGKEKLYSPEEIFHLSYERIADEIHGIPFPEALEEITIARNEAIADLRVESHRVTKPIQFFEVETDDTAKLSSIENTINEAYKKSENVVIPMGVIKEIKRTSSNAHSFDVLIYLKFLVRQFVTGCGMPEVIMGWTEGSTEASTSVIYLAYQQEIEDMQLYIQEQVKSQLGIDIELEFPASLEQKMQENESKRGKGTTTDPMKDG
ncbi:MAG: hypothetical protein RLY43_1831 [Bacteroidota bacterium]|jgi:hypothetical protein